MTAINTLQIPKDWDVGGLITFEEFGDLIRAPQPAVRGWRQRGIAARWARFDSCGRLYITAAGMRRLFSPATRHNERNG